MRISELESVVNALVEICDSWNDAAADEDRGRGNARIHLTLHDDGSGTLGKRRDYQGPHGDVTDCEDYHQFNDLSGLVSALRDEGIETTSGRPLRTKCHPEANGRKPQVGEVAFTVQLPLEDGEIIEISMGKKGRDILFGMLIADCHDSGEPEPS